MPILEPSAEALALIIVTLLLSLFTIIFGELVPKSLALAHTERVRPPPQRPRSTSCCASSGRSCAFLTAITTAVVAAARRGRQAQGVMSTEELQTHRRAGRRAGHPRGRGGADDPRGHRARRPAHPRGDGPAHRDGHPGGRRHDRGGHRPGRRGGPQPDPGLRGLDRRDRRHPVREGPAAVPEGLGRPSGRRCARSCGPRSSCPNR